MVPRNSRSSSAVVQPSQGMQPSSQGTPTKSRFNHAVEVCHTHSSSRGTPIKSMYTHRVKRYPHPSKARTHIAAKVQTLCGIRTSLGVQCPTYRNLSKTLLRHHRENMPMSGTRILTRINPILWRIYSILQALRCIGSCITGPGKVSLLTSYGHIGNPRTKCCPDVGQGQN